MLTVLESCRFWHLDFARIVILLILEELRVQIDFAVLRMTQKFMQDTCEISAELD